MPSALDTITLILLSKNSLLLLMHQLCFGDILRAFPLLVVTDHKPNTFVYTQPTLSISAERWSLQLLEKHSQLYKTLHIVPQVSSHYHHKGNLAAYRRALL